MNGKTESNQNNPTSSQTMQSGQQSSKDPLMNLFQKLNGNPNAAQAMQQALAKTRAELGGDEGLSDESGGENDSCSESGGQAV